MELLTTTLAISLAFNAYSLYHADARNDAVKAAKKQASDATTESSELLKMVEGMKTKDGVNHLLLSKNLHLKHLQTTLDETKKELKDTRRSLEWCRLLASARKVG